MINEFTAGSSTWAKSPLLGVVPNASADGDFLSRSTMGIATAPTLGRPCAIDLNRSRSVPNTHCDSDHIPEYPRIRDTLVHSVDSPSDAQEESGKRPRILCLAQRPVSLSFPKDLIDRCFLLTHVFRNFSGDFVTASRTLKRRVSEKAASRKFWVAGAPDQSIEHSFDGMSRVRIRQFSEHLHPNRVPIAIQRRKEELTLIPEGAVEAGVSLRQVDAGAAGQNKRLQGSRGHAAVSDLYKGFNRLREMSIERDLLVQEWLVSQASERLVHATQDRLKNTPFSEMDFSVRY